MAVQCVMEQLFFVLILKGMSEMHGWDKKQNFLPVSYVYVSLATVKSQIQERVELNTFCSTKGESQPAPRLLLFPFLSFIPTCIFPSVLVVVWYLAPASSYWADRFFFLFSFLFPPPASPPCLARLVFCQFSKVNQLAERSDEHWLQEKEQEWLFGPLDWVRLSHCLTTPLWWVGNRLGVTKLSAQLETGVGVS